MALANFRPLGPARILSCEEEEARARSMRQGADVATRNKKLDYGEIYHHKVVHRRPCERITNPGHPLSVDPAGVEAL